jgi:hypothetical protein
MIMVELDRGQAAFHTPFGVLVASCSPVAQLFSGVSRSRHSNNFGFPPGVDLPRLVSHGAWLNGCVACIPSSALHQPKDHNLANGDLIRTKLLAEQADEFMLWRSWPSPAPLNSIRRPWRRSSDRTSPIHR